MLRAALAARDRRRLEPPLDAPARHEPQVALVVGAHHLVVAVAVEHGAPRAAAPRPRARGPRPRRASPAARHCFSRHAGRRRPPRHTTDSKTPCAPRSPPLAAARAAARPRGGAAAAAHVAPPSSLAKSASGKPSASDPAPAPGHEVEDAGARDGGRRRGRAPALRRRPSGGACPSSVAASTRRAHARDLHERLGRGHRAGEGAERARSPRRACRVSPT